jgi:arabinofuranosyltransferase
MRAATTREATVLALIVSVYAAASLRFTWFNDDTFITFRYARHVASGAGMVWNVPGGAPVEGSSSLAWTALNALYLKLGMAPLFFSHLTSVLCGAAVLILLYLAGRSLLGLSPGWALLAPAMLCLQRQWLLMGVSGMETRAATLLVFAATLLLLREVLTEKHGFGSGALFVLATLVRPEAPLLHLAAGAGAVLARRDTATLRRVIESGAVHALALALLTLWRLDYFGQPLPNTFYVKVGAVQLDRGLPYVLQFLWRSDVWLWGTLLLYTAPLLRVRIPVPLAVLGLQTAAYLLWLAVLGGGRWEFRLIDPLLPGIALLSGGSLAALASAEVLPFTQGWPSQGVRRRRIAVGLAALLLVSQASSILRPFSAFGQVISAPSAYGAVQRIAADASVLRDFIGPDDRIATGWAGILPYVTGAWHFDPWGLNDPEIARRPFRKEGTVFHQRHASWADVVAQEVMFCDAFNHFIESAPFDPRTKRVVVPWVDDGLPIYSVALPDGRYWLFASARSRADVAARLAESGLRIHSVEALPAGFPRP